MISDTIRKYEQKTGETVTRPADCAKKEIGDEFMFWKLTCRDDVSFFYIDQMCGQMKNFRDFIREVMNTASIEWIVTATTRNPKTHIRKWKMERLPDYDYDYENRHYYVLKGHLSNLW